MELGEWDEIDYRFKIREYQNRVTKEEILIGKLEIQRSEIYLKLEEVKLILDKAMARKEKLQDEADWCMKKMEEKYDV